MCMDVHVLIQSDIFENIEKLQVRISKTKLQSQLLVGAKFGPKILDPISNRAILV